MTKKATPLQKLKVAKRTRARREEQERQEQKRKDTKPPPSSLFTHQNDDTAEVEQQMFSPSQSPPRKKMKAIQETVDSSETTANQAAPIADASTQVQPTPTTTNVSKPAASLPVRRLPLVQPPSYGAAAIGNTGINQFRSNNDDATDEEDQTRGDETINEDTDVDNNDGDDDTVVDRQLPSSIKVQLTLETDTNAQGLGLASPEMRNHVNNASQHNDANRSNLVDPISTTLAAAAASTPQQDRQLFRPIRPQSESLTPAEPPPSRSFLHPAVKQPPQRPNPLDIYNQFVGNGVGDDEKNSDGRVDDFNSSGTNTNPSAFSASAASSFAPIHPVNSHNPSRPHPDGDNDDDSPTDPSQLRWRLENRNLIDWQGKKEVCLGLLWLCCLGTIILFAIGLKAKSFWDVHRFQYHQLEEEYQALVDILVDTKMQPIPHQFCIIKEERSHAWWLPRKPTVLKEVLHSEQSRQSVVQMQEQIIALEAELKWWKNDANAKEAEMAGFKDQHEQDWNSIMNECTKAITNAIDNQDHDSVDTSLKQAAYAALDEDFRAITGGPMALGLLQEMQELNRMLDKSNEELMEQNLEWQQNMQELYVAFQELQEHRMKEKRQTAAENERFQEEYQALLQQRNRLAHETRELERETTEMKHLIQEDSRKRLAVWLGDGPFYQVEFKVHFQDDDDHTFHYMTVELDGQNMPHSVFTFVSQVELGAYQGQLRSPAFWFSLAGTNSVLGLPTDSDSLDEWGSQWPSLVFQETSEHVSKEPYSIGWIGMGPELYIGPPLLKNSPFGRVIRGSSVVDRMYSGTSSENLVNNQFHQLDHPVSLVAVTIF